MVVVPHVLRFSNINGQLLFSPPFAPARTANAAQLPHAAAAAITPRTPVGHVGVGTFVFLLIFKLRVLLKGSSEGGGGGEASGFVLMGRA